MKKSIIVITSIMLLAAGCQKTTGTTSPSTQKDTKQAENKTDAPKATLSPKQVLYQVASSIEANQINKALASFDSSIQSKISLSGMDNTARRKLASDIRSAKVVKDEENEKTYDAAGKKIALKKNDKGDWVITQW